MTKRRELDQPVVRVSRGELWVLFLLGVIAMALCVLRFVG